MYNPFTIPQYQSTTDDFGDLSSHLGAVSRLFSISIFCFFNFVPIDSNFFEITLQPLHWLTVLNSVFQTSGVTLAPDTRVIVLETAYVQKLVPLLLATEPRTVANYLGLRYVSGLGGETTKGMRDIGFNFNQVLTGAKEAPTRLVSAPAGSNSDLDSD